MQPSKISFVRYGTKGLLGGWRVDKRVSFACGFVERTDAINVRNNLLNENFKLDHFANNSTCLLSLNNNMIPRTPYERKPIRKTLLRVETMPLVDAAFYVSVNNINLMLINDVQYLKQKNGDRYIVLKNNYDVQINVHPDIINEKIVTDINGEPYDYNHALAEIMASVDEDEIEEDMEEHD